MNFRLKLSHPAGWLLGLTLVCGLLTVGCQQNSTDQAPAEPAEPDLQAQIEAVKSGTSDSIRVTRQKVDPAELAALAEITSLRELRLDFCPVSDAQVPMIVPLEGLEIINFPRSALTHQGVAQLAQLPKLRLVRLGGEGIDDAAVSALAENENIRFLHFLDCPVTDAALEEIAEMEKLQSFYIDNTPITDEGLSNLVKRRPRLHIHVDDAHPRGHNPGHSH